MTPACLHKKTYDLSQWHLKEKLVINGAATTIITKDKTTCSL